jgi:uncharacterized membrane protein HdeD (DUF308 family)
MPEPRGRDVHRQTTGLMSWILVVLGVALIVRTLTAGGGALALGLLLGVLFIAAGVGRLYVNARLARGAGER